MKLLILGASGRTGQHLVQQAMSAGHQVTALVRNPQKLEVTHEYPEGGTGGCHRCGSCQQGCRRQ